MEGLVSGMADSTRQVTQRSTSDTDVRLGRFAPPEVSPAEASAVLRRIGLVSYDFSGKTTFSTSSADWPPAYHEIHSFLDGVGCDAVVYPLLPVETSFASEVPERPAF